LPAQNKTIKTVAARNDPPANDRALRPHKNGYSVTVITKTKGTK